VAGVNNSSISQTILFVLTLAGLGIVGGLSLLTFTKSFGTIFLGQPRTKLSHQPQEVSNKMLVPQYATIAMMLSIAFFPQIYLKFIGTILVKLHPMQSNHSILDGIVASSVRISLYSLLLVGIVAATWLLRALLLKNKSLKRGATWGCGYVATNQRQQYTGKSFSKPLSKIFNVLVIEKKQFEELKQGEIFPARKSYGSHYQDLFEKKLIFPVADWMVNSANYFSFIQNGRIQSYVLYGIVFVLAMILLSIFNIVA
jgi:hypothetical protein